MAAATDAPQTGSRQPGSALFAVLWGMRGPLVAIAVFSMIVNVLMLMPAIFNLQVFDRVLSSRNITTLVMLSIVMLFLIAILGALEWARSRILIRTSVHFDRVIGKQLIDVSHRLAIEQNGGAGRQLLSDLALVRQFIAGQAIFAALDAPWVPLFFVVVMLLSPTLGAVVLVSGLALVALTYATEVTTHKPLGRANERAAEALRFATTNMRNSEVIEAMGMLPAMTARWQERQDEHLAEQAEASDRAGAIGAVSRFLRLAMQSATMAVGAYLAIRGDISPGAMIAASILAGRMLAPVEQLISSWKLWVGAIDAWKRIDSVLALPPRATSAVTLPAPAGEIALEGVAAAPPGVPTAFIRNVTLKVPAGASVAIIGASASGKTSLARLVAGVWAPRAGVVRLDGADLRHWPREQLGPHIGYLPQDVELLEGTVAENIARHGAIDSKKVLAAAQAAGVHDMILHFPKGYDTQVGIGGAYLSGGQRQRIALARALYGNPTLLILDEPNANLDEAGEIALDIALRMAKERKQTVFVVSHRQNAIRNCDLIIVMQAGQVAMYGPREQVIQALAAATRNGAAPQGEMRAAA